MRSVSGSVMMRTMMPITAFTNPNSAATQRSAKAPPDTSMPSISQDVSPKARANMTQRKSNALSTWPQRSRAGNDRA